MSKFSEQYFKLMEEDEEDEKKKKKNLPTLKKDTKSETKKETKTETKSSGSSFSDEYNRLMGSAPTTQDYIKSFNGALDALKEENSRAEFGGKRTDTGKSFGEKKEEEERTWFQKGAFEDGYDFGDVTKTILGTVTDAAENVSAGIIGMGEKVVDTAAQLGAWSYGGLTPVTTKGAFGLPTTTYTYSAEERVKAKEEAMDFIAKDLYDEEAVAKKIISAPVKNLTGIDAEEDSLFGEKTDALAQSAGQLAATAGLQAVGIPWFVTTGVTSYGGELENAYKQGATFEQAGASAAISAGAEILSEKLSGGIKFGGKALDDFAVSRLSRAISNKTLRALAKFGMDAVGEGAEEVISQVFSNLGSSLYKEENLGELLASEEAIDEYIESFIGGAVLGGGSSVVNNVVSGAQGKDAVTGLTENEQKVIDKVYKDAVAEAEQDGKKLTQKEKDKLYEEALDQMDKGYISTDTIEEVLGGETYKDYKNTVEYEDFLFQQYEELGNKQNPTLAEQTRYNELLERKKNIEQTSQRNALKSRLSEEVSGLVQSDRLAESYNERGRRSQAFEADLTKYDSKAQETIQKAIDSGILNNTNRTHEFVDLIAKISADKGVPFDFTNNAKLKDSGFAVEGKQVNGFVHNGNITLNIDSAKALQSTVGHEVTHILEGTELYDALSQSVIEYAKSKGDYQGRFDTLSKLYEGVEGANIDAELTADLVGDYLFSDTDFVKNLSVQNRNVFQKIWDEVKYLCKVATAGSKEARELARVQKAFEDAYRESGEGAEGTKYSLTDNSGKQLTKEQNEYFKDSKMRDDDGNLMVMYHGSQDAGFHVFDASMSDDDTSFFFVDRNDVAASYSGTTETYEAKTIRSAEDMNKFLAEIGYDHYEAVEKDGKFELLENNEHVAWSDTAQGIYEEFCWYEGVGDGDANYKVYLNLKNPLVVDAKGKNWDMVGREFSQKLYDKYMSLTDAEKAALIDATKWEDFGTFRDEVNDAVDYVSNPARNGGYIDDYQRSIASAVEKLRNAKGELDMYTLHYFATENFAEDVIREDATEWMNTRDYAQKAKSGGYDGVIFKNIVDVGGYGGDYTPSTVAIAFDSNQIKSVANEKPTADKDIRFSLSEPVEQTKDLMALHNLQSSELLKSLDLGGLPMPSVAIIKATDSHEQYGDVSLILPKETIDPKASSANKVYGGDAWTPTYPKIEYKPSAKAEKRISDKYYELANRIGYDAVRPMYGYVSELERQLNFAGGEAAMLKELYEDTRMMQVYLEDSGKGKVEPIIKETRTEATEAEKEMNQWFIDKLGEDVIRSFKAPSGVNPMTHRKAFMEQYGEQAEQAYRDLLVEKFDFSPEDVSGVMDNTDTKDLMRFLRNAVIYLNNGGVTVKTETDYQATDEAIRNAAADGYTAWVDSIFSGVEEKSGIRNNQDYYTRSGNPRSWDALHWENTLENVVKTMKGQEETGTGSFSPYNSFASLSHKRYGSIAEIKADAGRLGKVSQEEYEALGDSFANRFAKIADSIKDPAERNPFIATDEAAELIVDAVRTQKTKAGMLSYLQKWNKRVTEQTVDDVVSLVNDIANMPTGYFEAKPQRAVGFDEVGVFVIPNNADVKLKQELLNRGYAIAEYDPTIEGHRQQVVNQFEEYKFSLSNVGEPVRRNLSDIYGKDIKLEQEIAPVDESRLNELGEQRDQILNRASELDHKKGRTEEETFEMERLYRQADEIRQDMEAMFPDDMAPVQTELDQLVQEQRALETAMQEAYNADDGDRVQALTARYGEVLARIGELENEIAADESGRLDSLTDADVPPEVEAPYQRQTIITDDPLADRNIAEVGNPKVNAYMYENPEVKPFFQEEAAVMLDELNNSQKGEKWFINGDFAGIGAESYYRVGGTKRDTSADIAYLLDGGWKGGADKSAKGYSYDQIEKGLLAIIEDNGAENNAVSKRIEFILNDRLMKGYKNFFTNRYVEPNQDYIRMLDEKQVTEYSKEAFDAFMANADEYAPISEEIAPVVETPAEVAPVKEVYEAIRPKPEKEPRMVRADNAPEGKQRKWIETSTESEAVDGLVTADDIPDDVRYYQVKSNKKTLEAANARLERDGYAKSREYFEGRMSERKLSVEDIALGERLIQEAAKAGDAAAVRDLIVDVSIIGTELGQRVQALSLIRRLTPEGQLKALQRTIERGKAKGDKSFNGVELTQELIDHVLSVYGTDGTYDQTELNRAVEDVKQRIADQMPVTVSDYINAWRYLSMLGNPKTHIRNLVSNVAMLGTRTVKNAVARTVEDVFLPEQELAPTKNQPKMRRVIQNGTRVKAADRGNIGTVRGFDPATKKYTVQFENQKGHSATVQLDAKLITPLNPTNGKAADGSDGKSGHVRTKTWERSTEAVKNYAKQATKELEAAISGDKYSEEGSIKAKRKIFKTGVGNALSEGNSYLLSAEDSLFSRPAFRHALAEYLTANGVKTEADIKNNPELVEKAKDYALDEAKKATFQQDSYLATKIGEIERKNPLYGIAIGSTIPFKKTPINIAKTGVAYSPLGFARNVYDLVQVKKGNMDASEAVDHLAQTLTGTSLAVIGYALASAGVLNGAGEDDKEGKYDYQLGEQAYSFTFGDSTYSLSWLSPVAMPLFVGANAYEQLVEGKEWNGDTVIETLAQTLDPLSEMSFLSSLDDVLSSYETGTQKIGASIGAMAQNYVTQFIPTLSSQVATVLDDTKRSTKVAGDSGFKLFDETLNQIKYKIPGLRQTLEPSTDIWGNEVKQTENVLTRAFETFLAPYAKRENIATEVDEEIKELYGETGDNGLIPSIPYNYVNYDGEKYKMSAGEYTDYKKVYGQTALELLEELFATETYGKADSESRADMVNKVYDYARDEAKREYFAGNGIEFTNATKDGVEYYDIAPIKGAIENDMTPEEYSFSEDYPEKYAIAKKIGGYDVYMDYKEATKEMKLDEKAAYIANMDLTTAQKNALINGETDRKEPIDMAGYDTSVYGSFDEFEYAKENPGKYKIAQVIGGYDTYVSYKDVIGDFEADKDEYGESISGSKKEKVAEYINGLDIDYGQKIILYRSMYSSKEDKNNYNADIVEYLDSRSDISYEEMVEILEALDMTVSGNNVTW